MTTREAPHVYVVDRDGTVLFASRAVIDVQSHDVLKRTFRAAIDSAQAGDESPLRFDGRLVRAQRLVTSGGVENYAVIMERVAEVTPTFSGTVAEEIDVSADSA